MAYEHSEGEGALFKNDKQNDRQPDYKGTIVIGDTTYEIAAWERISQRGVAFFSLKVSIPNEFSFQQSSQSIHKDVFSLKDNKTPNGNSPSNNNDENLPF